MTQTPNLNLPYIMAAQAQKHVTHNEAIRALDAIVQIAVIDKDLTSPPPSPTDGNRYIIAVGAIGEWAGKDDQIAAWQDGAWMYYSPKKGWLTWIEDEEQIYVWSDSLWKQVGDSDLQNIPLLGINATADTGSRLSLSSPASLFNHEGDGHQININKNTTSDTASFLFQTNWSGRVELGTTGDDDFHVKVSPDGDTWNNALVIDRNTANVDIGISTLHVDAVNKKIGVGITAPIGTLHVKSGPSGATPAGWANDVVFENNAAFGMSFLVPATNSASIVFGSPSFPTDGFVAYRNQERELRFQATNTDVGYWSSTRLHSTVPIQYPSHVKASLPSAATAGQQIFISNDAGGATMAFSDGTNWRRMSDRAVVS